MTPSVFQTANRLQALIRRHLALPCPVCSAGAGDTSSLGEAERTEAVALLGGHPSPCVRCWRPATVRLEQLGPDRLDRLLAILGPLEANDWRVA